ncbi:hypothetical protein NA57DRAFT_37718 [Rhizodiscina lignyota]|uniref:SWIRM domain-containing protein n=1 Tax=Rhizodiscina lignyota TaxID=1504668 RepID=A0A9P4M6D2_9PEZI|nr:hypothetical protein NA57DRAFT_37718 [Rhizodiscina lignyota]
MADSVNGATFLQSPLKSAQNVSSTSLSDIPWQNSPAQPKSRITVDHSTRTPGGSKKSEAEWKPRTSIPSILPPWEFARQCFLATYSSRLNPLALHPGEYKLLRDYITLPQVPIYLNIRNAILRLWTRNPLVGVTKEEAAGCARESRYFTLASIAHQWLIRQGYINFGCLDLPNTAGSIPRVKAKGGKRCTIVVIGAGMSGLGSARQLEGLIAQFGKHWTDQGEGPPKVIVLEGRGRIGGRVYSHPLREQHSDTLPAGLRNTAEMGAQIVTGFEHGNPMNIIIRGQLALHTYALKDNSILYDHDGTIVDKTQDVMVESLYNDILERASVFRNLSQPPRTVEVDRLQMQQGKEPADDGGETISELERTGKINTEADAQDQAKSQAPKQAAISTEKLTGRAYQIAGLGSRVPAAEAANTMGWSLVNGTPNTATITLQPPTDATNPGTLGDIMDDGLMQYQNMIHFSARDLRLYNWHHANLEYANSANVSQLSLTGWDQDLGNEFEGEHSEIVGGYSQVPRGLWQSPYPLDVRFRKKVMAINKDQESSRSTIVCQDGETFEADQIIISTPLGVLKSGAINFSPPLPDWKMGAIERLGFGLLNKVILVFEKPFWEEDRDMFGLLNDTEFSGSLYQKHYSSRRGRFYLFWNCIKTSGRPTLVALMAGDAAYQTEDEDNNSLIKEVTSRLSKMFAPKIVPLPSEVIVTRWNKDPFACGSYSYVGPRTRPGDYDAMAQPWGSIHFAGEATCGTHPATVHGAYLSGLRAASEVIEELLGPIAIPHPLVPPRSKTDTPLVAQGMKRKFSDPTIPQTSPAKGQVEAYEASIIGAILSTIGERPLKPAKQGVNPFLLYQKDHWYSCKAACDAEQQRKTNNPSAKASKTEIRVSLGNQWRNAPTEVRKPYLDQAQNSRDGVAASTADYKEKVKKWDEDAVRIREEFIEKNPLPGGAEKQFSGRTAIELGRVRPNRKMSGYGEGSEDEPA